MKAALFLAVLVTLFANASAQARNCQQYKIQMFGGQHGNPRHIPSTLDCFLFIITIASVLRLNLMGRW